jgi:anaerobic magnesium-protoporphyrin IX monomethyl ester cyclase
VLELHPGICSVYLEIETIGLNQEWAIALCERLKAFNAERPSPLSFGCNLRVVPNFKPDALFAAMQAANVKFLNIGLESGSERVRTEILHRHYSNDDLLNTVTIARRHNLHVNLYNLIGIPGETYEDFLDTVKMNRLLAPDSHMTSIFDPYPGTQLHKMCEEQGYLQTARKSPFGRDRAQLNLPGFPRAKIQHCSNWFDYYVFKGRLSNRQLFLRLGIRWFRSSRLLFTLSRWRPVVRFLRIVKSRTRNA